MGLACDEDTAVCGIEEGQPMEGQSRDVRKRVFEPEEVRELFPELFLSDSKPITVLQYSEDTHGWLLCVATAAEQGKGQYSLGGFRIVPEDRASLSGFSALRESVGLALGMEQKVQWSRVVRIAGPSSQKHLDQVVGGKCVLLPTAGSRIGEPLDFSLLDFATQCLQDANQTFGMRINTGQDLGHGMMSDGLRSSLEYLHAQFEGSIVADTSLPTAAGNFHVLVGALEALGIPLSEARLGIIGCGNIGTHVLRSVTERGALVEALEASERRRGELAASDVRAFSPEHKLEFLAKPFDALVINASGGTLDSESVQIVAQNQAIRIICGCENLLMPHPEDERILLNHRKIFCPTEYCGMMGYLTALEEYVSFIEKKPFSISEMVQVASGLTQSTKAAVELVVRENFTLSFREAVLRK